MRDMTEIDTEVHTVTDLMAAVATAMRDGDLAMLWGLLEKVDGWCQTPEEFEAQKELILAAMDAVERLAELE